MAYPDLVRRLARIPPFDRVPDDVLGDIGEHLALRVLEPGEPVYGGAGETGTLAVVVGGRLDVLAGTGADAFEVAQVGPGEVIGEIAALLGGKRTATVRAVVASEVLTFTAEGVALLVDRAPGVVEHLFETATRRLRETQLAAALDRHFGAGPDRSRHPFVDSVEWVTLRAGELLFAEGDEADAAYVVVSGRLRQVHNEDSPGRRSQGAFLAEIGAGELVGELTLLQATPRTFSVAATRDSTLARLPSDAFDRLAREHPERMLAVVRTFLDGLVDPQARRRPTALTIAVLVVAPSIDGHKLTTRFAEQLGQFADARHLWAGYVDDQLGRPGIANSPRDTPGDLRVRYWLDDAEKDHEVVVLETDPEWTPWTRRALGQADHVVVVVDATVSDPAPGRLESAVYELFAGSPTPPRTTLVLLHPTDADDPRNTVRWLELRPVTDHLHIRRDHEPHLARLARLASGRAISLVLGGGGARGFAHIGVIQALRDLNIPVDMVGASSIGAPLALAVALEIGDDEVIERAVANFVRLKDYTIPVVAVLKGKAITEHIEAAVEGRDFEDCWVPFFCISTSIARAEDIVHRSGPMGPAIRASVSIPGVLPPVALDGDVLIDGATINNLPVDRMREANPTGTIIAIDVSRTDAPPTTSSFPPQTSGWRALVSGLRRSEPGSVPPKIGATLAASSLVGANQVKNRQLDEQIADLYLALDVHLALLDFSPKNVRLGARIGYEASFERLAAWRDRQASPVTES